MPEIKHHQKAGGGAATKTSGSRLEDLEMPDPFPPASQVAGEPGTHRPNPCLGPLISTPVWVQDPNCWAEPTLTFPVPPALQGFNSPQTLVQPWPIPLWRAVTPTTRFMQQKHAAEAMSTKPF